MSAETAILAAVALVDVILCGAWPWVIAIAVVELVAAFVGGVNK